MGCEICGKDSGIVFVLLPIKKPCGCLNTIGCLECAQKTSVYCQKHQLPHLGFEDNTTACCKCIEETMAKEGTNEDEIFKVLCQRLPTVEFNRLLEWATLSAVVTRNSETTCVLRAIVTKALRAQRGVKEVVDEIIISQSVNSILPQVSQNNIGEF